MSTLEIEDMARMECVNGLAILANTVPSAFWTIVQIYSQPEVLERVRVLAAAAVADEHQDMAGSETRKRKTIDILQIQRSPNKMQHLIQEVIRLRTTGIGPRVVREDVILQERYLLRKGSTVIIPNRAVHFDKDVWGDEADVFKEDRFSVSSPTNHGGHKAAANKVSPKVSPTAYRGFGGGATICPGKHFAIE
ncbi:MAG: hypothetical protein Q9196_002420, partial [Gyalolechia fulgens]